MPPRTAGSTTSTPPPPQPAMVDNPVWLDLQRQVSGLEARRDQLLIDRTPLHPAVQEIDRRLAEAKEQLATTAHQIPDNRASSAGEVVEAPPDDAPPQAATAVARPVTWNESPCSSSTPAPTFCEIMYPKASRKRWRPLWPTSSTHRKPVVISIAPQRWGSSSSGKASGKRCCARGMLAMAKTMTLMPVSKP